MEDNKDMQEVLGCLPREELRRMLKTELQKDTSSIDDTLVRQLLTELRSRGTDRAFTDDETVDAACQKFLAGTEATPTRRKHWYQSWMLKVASVILVLGGLFFSLSAAVQADPVRDVLGWWSDSVLQLLRPGEKPNVQEYVFTTDHPGLQQIYDAVTELGITEQIVPQKLSKEYELTEIKRLQFMGDESIFTRLISKDNEIMFTVIVHSGKNMLQYEKDANNVSIWELSGIEHYVISNKDEKTVSWVLDEIECTITTECPEEDVYKLVKSIYTLED